MLPSFKYRNCHFNARGKSSSTSMVENDDVAFHFQIISCQLEFVGVDYFDMILCPV